MKKLALFHVILSIVLMIVFVSDGSAFEEADEQSASFHQNREFRRQDRFRDARQQGDRHKNRAREMVTTLKIWKITENLEVDETLAERLFPRVRDLENLRFEQQRELMDLTTQLRRKIQDTGVETEQLQKLSEQLKNLKVDHAIAERDMLDTVFELLNPQQRAEFLLLEAEFHQNMRRFLRDRKRGFQNQPNHSFMPEKPDTTR